MRGDQSGQRASRAAHPRAARTQTTTPAGNNSPRCTPGPECCKMSPHTPAVLPKLWSENEQAQVRIDPDGPEGRRVHGSRADPGQDDRGARAAHREGRRRRRAGAVLPGNLHAALLLPEPGPQMVRGGRSGSRRPHHAAHAGVREETQHGDGRSGLRRSDDRRVLQHRRGHRCRRQVSRQISQDAHPAGRSGLLREVLLQARRSRLSRCSRPRT